MFVKNPIMINKEFIFPCKSNKLFKFLSETKKIPYISRVLDQKDNKFIWMFTRSEDLEKALIEWKDNKENGNLAYAKSN